MRISDWSSDVCSSDLDEQRVADDPERHAERAIDELRCKADQDEREQGGGAQRRKVDHRFIPTVLVDNRMPAFAGLGESNFAAGEERICCHDRSNPDESSESRDVFGEMIADIVEEGT